MSRGRISKWRSDPLVGDAVLNQPHEVGVNIASVESHLSAVLQSLFANRPPITSDPEKMVGKPRDHVSTPDARKVAVTHTHPQVPQKLKARSRSPQTYCVDAAPSFMSMVTSEGR